MSETSMQKGDYEFFEAADGQPLLTFDDQYFALADQPTRRWVETDGNHDVTRVWERGSYVWLHPESDEPEDTPHLYLSERGQSRYREYLVSHDGGRTVLTPTDVRRGAEELRAAQRG